MRATGIVRLAVFVVAVSCTGTIEDPMLGQGGAGSGQDLPSPTSPGPAQAPGLPGPELAATSRLRRLTVDEYNKTVFQLLGDRVDAGGILPDDVRSPFDNDSSTQLMSPALIAAAELLADDVVARLLANKARRDRTVGCVPAGATDTGCLRQFITRFGRLAWRRSLAGEDVATLMKFSDLARQDNDFYSAAGGVIRALLQDPEFLFRVELGAPVPGSPGLFRLSGPETATRLSYLLWGQAPDKDLLDLAESGGLDTTDGVRKAASDMLANPAARARVARFHALWMGYGEPAHPTLGKAMKAETEALISRVIFQERQPWQELLRHPETYVTWDLATYYGLTPPRTLAPGTHGAAWVPYAGTQRQGLLSHATFLSLAGTEQEDTMTIRRGKLILDGLFCLSLPDKPAVLPNTTAPAPRTPCKRDVLEAKTAPGGCAGCHVLMNPVGFGLDRYDGLGRYREHYPDPESGKSSTRCPISGDGELSGRHFNGPDGLATLMLADERLNACVAKRLYQLAMGIGDGTDPTTMKPKLDDVDHRFLDLMTKRLGVADFRFDQLVLDFVSSGAFLHRRDGV